MARVAVEYRAASSSRGRTGSALIRVALIKHDSPADPFNPESAATDQRGATSATVVADEADAQWAAWGAGR